MIQENKIKPIFDLLKKEHSETMLSDFSRRFDAFKILISTILSARAKDETTIPICEELFKKYSKPIDLVNADKKEIQKIIRKSGFFRQKTKYIIETARIIHEKYKNKVPDNLEELVNLPGVGHKVASCVMVYAHKVPEIPVDIHVAVISHRLGWTKHKSPEKIWKDLKQNIPKKYWMDINELFVTHGKKICETRKPRCSICPLNNLCPKVGVKNHDWIIISNR